MATNLIQPQEFLARVDQECLDLWASFRDLRQASERGHREGVADATLRHINAHAWLYYLCLSTLRMASSAAVYFAQKAPAVLSGLRNTSFISGITICGFITNAITSVQETTGIMRQSRLLSIFRGNIYQENFLILAGDLETIADRYSPAELETRLRPWLMEEKQLHARDKLQKLAENIRLGEVGSIAEGIELMAQMRSLTIKKLAMHIIGLLGVLISIAGLIGSLVACPPVAVFALLAIGTVFGVARTIMLKGYVDNPDGTFSLLRCLPSCLRPAVGS